MNNKQISCIHVKNGIRTNNDGTAFFCCMSNEYLTDSSGEIKSVNEVTLMDLRKGKKAIEITEALNAGISHPHCSNCWDEEKSGIESKRIRDNKFYQDKIMNNDQELKIIELNSGTTCNLKCRICGPWASSMWNKDYLTIDPFMEESEYKEYTLKLSRGYDTTLFKGESSEFLKDIIKIEMFGGEPFLIKHHWKLLQLSQNLGYSKNQEIAFNTNGTILNESHLTLLKNFKSTIINVSIDGIGDQFEYQRHPAKWNTVYSNLLRLKEYANEHSAYVSVYVTINIYNIFYLNDIILFFKNQNIQVHLNMVHNPLWFSIKNIPDDVKTQIALHLATYERNEYSDKVDSVIEFMVSSNCDNLHWNKFKEITNILDNSRGENFSKVFPELYQIIK